MNQYRAVTKERKDTSHTFHLLMTLLTCGFWGLLVWLPITMWHSMGPRRKVVTKHYVPPQYGPPQQIQGPPTYVYPPLPPGQYPHQQPPPPPAGPWYQ